MFRSLPSVNASCLRYHPHLTSFYWWYVLFACFFTFIPPRTCVSEIFMGLFCEYTPQAILAFGFFRENIIIYIFCIVYVGVQFFLRHNHIRRRHLITLPFCASAPFTILQSLSHIAHMFASVSTIDTARPGAVAPRSGSRASTMASPSANGRLLPSFPTAKTYCLANFHSLFNLQ